MTMAMSKLSSVIVMECSSLSVSPVREDFKCFSKNALEIKNDFYDQIARLGKIISAEFFEFRLLAQLKFCTILSIQPFAQF